MLGALLGNYRVIDTLGEGGMGVVYVGRHETLGRRVVVKVLRPDMSKKTDMIKRFYNEAQAATAINNPGIAQVFDFGTTPEGQMYFVMELLEGETLSARLRNGRLDPVECCRIGRQIANVLQAAHTAGITHRDLKPDNLFLVPDAEVAGGERVKVLDFGLAKLANEARPVKTRTGVIMGTPSYMSPEQCRGISNADARSDIYSLGCILFKMACGRAPFVGDVLADVIIAHVQEPVPDPRRFATDLPADLAMLIMKMLAKNPNSRPQTMAAVSGAIDKILSALGAPTTHLSQPHAASSGRMPAAARMPTPPPLPPRALTPPPEDPPSLTVADPVPLSLDDTQPATSAAPEVSVTENTTMPVMQLSEEAPEAARPPARWDTASPPMSSDSVDLSAAPELSEVPEASGAAKPPATAKRSGLVKATGAETSETPETSGAVELSGMSRLRTRRLPLALAGLIAAGVAITLAIVLAGGDPRPPAPPVPGGATEAPVSGAAAMAGEVFARCRDFQTERKWTELTRCADELQPLDPDRAEALRSRALQERKSASRVAAVEAALRKGNLKQAKAELELVWPESVEHADIKRKYASAEDQAIGDLAADLARVKDAACRKHKALLDKEKALKPPRITEEAARRTPCEPTTTCDVAALARRGRLQASSGQLGAALMSYETAYVCEPTPALALKAFTLACNVRNLPKARLYWKQLEPGARTGALSACTRRGISAPALNAP